MHRDFGFAFIAVILFNLTASGVALWLLGSVITSGVKAISDNCGTEYIIESVVSGDWFCPSEVTKDEPV